MNHTQAKEQLFDQTFLIGAWRRSRALKFLLRATDAEAVRTLVDAVDRKHPESAAIQRHLAGVSSPDAATGLTASWTQRRRDWLGPVAIERALAVNGGAGLPMDRETAWLVVPHLAAKSACSAAAESFVQQAIKTQPPFVQALLLKAGRGSTLSRNAAAVAGALALLSDADTDVRNAARNWLHAARSRPGEAAAEVTLRQPAVKEAVRVLIEVVDGQHAESALLQEFLGARTDRETAETLAEGWAARHQPWLGPIAVERALALGCGAALPMDRQTAWLVAPHLAGKGAAAKAAEQYAQATIQAQPAYLQAFIFKIGRGAKLELSRGAVFGAVELLGDTDPEVRSGAEAWLKALPNVQQWNDLFVDEWIRTQSPFLASLVAEPRPPSSPAKETLIHLVHGNVERYRKLDDRDGALLAEALVLATPEMRKAINDVVLNARDAALADAYRQATAAGAQQADPQVALRALMASGNEDALFETVRDMTLAEVLPLCRHWAETKRRPKTERYRAIVDRAVAVFERLPDVEIEPAPPLPEGLRDLFEVWQSETVPDAWLKQELEGGDPLTRARALFLGSSRGSVNEAALRSRAKSPEWLERLVVALHFPDALAADEPVLWIRNCVGAEGGLTSAKLVCGPEEAQRTEAVCASFKQAKGRLAERNLALAEILAAFRVLSGGWIRVTDDDSAQDKRAGRVSAAEVSQDDLKF